MRKFFDDFARKQGFDPLVAENWRHFHVEEIRREVRKGKKEKVRNEKEEERRKKNPTKTDTREREKREKIEANESMKGGAAVVRHYGGSMAKALKDAYSEVEWNERKEFFRAPSK